MTTQAIIDIPPPVTARTRALLSPCLLLVLLACVEPPAPADSGTKDADRARGGQHTSTGTPGPIDNRFPPDPAFAGAPLSKTTLASGIIVEEFVLGEGEAAKAGAEVSMNYYGTLEDGTMFDTSLKRNQPYTFELGKGRVIKGWDQGIPGMKVGGKRRLTIPAKLAYGSRAKGKIPANSQLTFTVELVAMIPPPPDPQGDEAFEAEPLRRTELEGGLIIEDISDGEGRVAKAGDSISMHYTGMLDNGIVFDSSVPKKKVLTFVLGTKRVIAGWEQGIPGMKVGGLRRLIIPAKLAYGDRVKGRIPANSRLTFTVELMAVKDAPPARHHRPRARPHH